MEMSTCFGSRSLKHRKDLGVFSVWNIETLVNCKSSTRLLRVSSRKMRLWRTWPQVLCYVTRFSTFLQFPGWPKNSSSPSGAKVAITPRIQWNQCDPMIHACLIRLGRPNSSCCCSTSCCCCKSGGPCSSNASLKCLMLPAATYKNPWDKPQYYYSVKTSCDLNLSRSSSQQKYVFHSPLPIIWSKNKNDTTIFTSHLSGFFQHFLHGHFNISVRPFQLLPIGPRSPEHPDPWFLLLDGRWLRVWRTKKQIEKKGWHKEPTCKGWLVHICHLFSC